MSAYLLLHLANASRRRGDHAWHLLASKHHAGREDNWWPIAKWGIAIREALIIMARCGRL